MGFIDSPAFLKHSRAGHSDPLDKCIHDMNP